MGLEVKLIIAKKQQQEDEEVPVAAGEGSGDAKTTDDTGVEFDMQVESSGKFSRKANWEDLNQFTGKEITSDVLRDMIVTYQTKCFPDGEFLLEHVTFCLKVLFFGRVRVVDAPSCWRL